MQTLHTLQPVSQLIQECTRDIRWEMEQIRNRVTIEEIDRMADAELTGHPPVWPAVLLELQKGYLLSRLTRHLNFHIRHENIISTVRGLEFTGPFPTFSLKTLLPLARQYRHTCTAAQCIEYVGNKLWDKTLSPLKPKFFPLEIKTATLVMKSTGCSAACQSSFARNDLARRVHGLLLNCLHEWETLLLDQVSRFISEAQEVVPAFTQDLAV
jgi:hypothetical protein